MGLIFRVLLLSGLSCVLAAVALGWVGMQALTAILPDVTVNLNGEVFHWSPSDPDTLGWWGAGLMLALICLVVVVPLLLLLGVALPVLLVLVLAGLSLGAAALVVGLVLLPVCLLLWGLWRLLRWARPQTLSTAA